MTGLIIAAIMAYQRWAPGWVKGNCQAQPHCSEYGLKAVAAHGALRGTAMIARRLISIDEHCGRPWPN